MKSAPATATNKVKRAGKPVVMAKKKSMAVQQLKKNSAPAVVASAVVQGPLDRPHHGVRATDVGLGVLEIEDSVFVDLVNRDKTYRIMIVEMMKYMHMVTDWDSVHKVRGYDTVHIERGFDVIRGQLIERAIDKMVMSIITNNSTEPFDIGEAYKKPLDFNKISDLADFNFDCINVLRRVAA